MISTSKAYSKKLKHLCLQGMIRQHQDSFQGAPERSKWHVRNIP